MTTQIAAVTSVVSSMRNDWNNEALKTAVRATATSVVNGTSVRVLSCISFSLSIWFLFLSLLLCFALSVSFPFFHLPPFLFLFCSYFLLAYARHLRLTWSPLALSTHSSEVQKQLKQTAAKSNVDIKNALFYFSSLFQSAISDIQQAVEYAVNQADPSLATTHPVGRDYGYQSEVDAGSAECK